MSCDDGRVVRSSHAVLAIGSVPNTDGLGLDAAGVDTDAGGYIPINHNCVTNVPHIYAAGDVSGKLPLSSVASMQGRKVAERLMGLHAGPHRHLDYDKAASAIFTEPEIADVGLAEAEAFAAGRKIRVTKVPFSATAKALINNQPQGFVKIVSDPATGVVLGGSIVGRHAAELISVIAIAVTAGSRSPTSSRACSSTRRSAKPSPKPPSRPPREGQSPIFMTTSPPPTVSPGATLISLTVPARSVAIWFSIFIASSTTTGWPASTVSPTSTRILTIVPCIGTVTSPLPDPPAGTAARRPRGAACGPPPSPATPRRLPTRAPTATRRSACR